MCCSRACLCLAFVVFAGLAHAEAGKELRGVALVIGQSDYENIPKLPNPEHDARAIEEMLDSLGFETDVSNDRDARKLRRDLEGFVEDAEGADVAIIYYSGHGIEAGGENFLVPVDADVGSLEDAGEKLVPLSADPRRAEEVRAGDHRAAGRLPQRSVPAGFGAQAFAGRRGQADRRRRAWRDARRRCPQGPGLLHRQPTTASAR